MKLLAVADIHLGRPPSRLPAELAGRAARLGPAGAWERLVEAALQEPVDALLASGDAVECESDFFEAFRVLSAGLRRLAGAGVIVLGVAGNHDVRVLPRLAGEIPGFRLLGAGGRWEAFPLEAGGERVTVHGWSFPRARVTGSPLAGGVPERQPGLNIGLLHCDRDQSAGPYAPVSARELEQAGLDGWLLGHVHRPDQLRADRLNGYLGSAAGLDPGEPGARGPWLITIESGSVRAVEHWPLAPLRWEALTVDVSGLGDPEEARPRVLAAVRELDAVLSAGRFAPEAVGLRVRFTGRARSGARFAGVIPDDDRGDFHRGDSGIHYFVERVIPEVLPEINLEELAARPDPAGLLARRLLLLERPDGDPGRRALLDRARPRLAAAAARPAWRALEGPFDDDRALADCLRRSGILLLAEMLARDETEGP